MSLNPSNTTFKAETLNLANAKFVSHGVRKPEYKEFAFEADRNEKQKKSLQEKVATFWEEVNQHDYTAPSSTLFKPKLIRGCINMSDADDDDADGNNNDVDDDDTTYVNASDSEKDASRKYLRNQTWSHTLCLFKKRGLDKLALAARSKVSNRHEVKYPLQYSDEVCQKFIADYGTNVSMSD